MYLRRAAEQPLKDMLAGDKVGIILGARQVGKTTLVEHVLAGQPAALFFWRTRAQSEVDLVVKQGSSLRAFEIKWSSRRSSGRAFREAYGAEIELVGPDNPFTTSPTV